MSLLKRLFCKHDYVYKSQHMTGGGMGKVIYHECKKCGKVKIYII
jgi:uncharacterized OB-fold protein